MLIKKVVKFIGVGYVILVVGKGKNYVLAELLHYNVLVIVKKLIANYVDLKHKNLYN
jgi:hypothetical protein